MPLPIVVIGALKIGALVVAAAGGGAAFAAALNWRWIIGNWKGQCIAVLGERKVGKTTLIRFLREGQIPDPTKLEGTPIAEDYKGTFRKLGTLQLILKDGLDVGGGLESPQSFWMTEVDKADRIFYLFRADRLRAGHEETIGRIEHDLQNIQSWLDQNEPNQTKKFIILVGTYADKDPAFERNSQDAITIYSEMIEKVPTIKNRKSLAQAKVLAGSLDTTADTERLVIAILNTAEADHDKRPTVFRPKSRQSWA